jgi:hypothetical protein
MPTPPREPLRPPLPGNKQGICLCCKRVFTLKPTGRPPIYCSDACRQVDWHLARVERLIAAVNDGAPLEGKSLLRQRLWALSNRLVINRGKGNGTLRGTRRERPTPE